MMLSSQSGARPAFTRSPLLRAFACWVLFVLLLIVCTVLFTLLAGQPDRLLYGLLGTAAAFAATALLYPRSGWTAYGLLPGPKTLRHFGAGLLSGLLLLALIVGVISAASGLHLARTGSTWSLARMVGILGFLPLALMEEIPFRGAPFRQLVTRKGLRTAQVAGALAFALYHLANGWGLAQSLLGPFVWSFVFGLAAVRSDGIALPTGLHAGLNIGQSLVGLGMGRTEPLWQFVKADGRSEGALGQTMPAGLVVQVVLLVLALLLTERFARKGQPGKPSAHPAP